MWDLQMIREIINRLAYNQNPDTNKVFNKIIFKQIVSQILYGL